MSQDPLIFNGKKYISSRRASELTGYTIDYIGQLSRAQKLRSRMVGRNRFIDENQLLEYAANFSDPVLKSDEQRERVFSESDFVSDSVDDNPSLETKDDYESLESKEPEDTGISSKRDNQMTSDFDKDKARSTKISFVGSLVVVILVGAFLNTQPGAQGFRAFSENLNQSENILVDNSANVTDTAVFESLNKVDKVFLGYLDNLDKKISLFFIDTRDKILSLLEDDSDVIYVENTTPGVEVVNPVAGTSGEYEIDEEKLREYVREIMLAERSTFAPGGPYGGVVALPSSGDPVQDEILKQRIKDSFSDEVIVQFDSSGSSGVIRPVFKSGAGLEENYMFLLVPVEK